MRFVPSTFNRDKEHQAMSPMAWVSHALRGLFGKLVGVIRQKPLAGVPEAQNQVSVSPRPEHATPLVAILQWNTDLCPKLKQL